MANSISMTWQLLCDDHGFTREHYNQLKKFSPEVLGEIIAEIACCHPSTSVLLRNKWLTPPEDILGQVICEYERKIQNCLSFRSEKEVESWLNEMYCAVIAPLYRVANGQGITMVIHILDVSRAQLAQRMKISGNKPDKRRRRCDEAADAEVLARILDIISDMPTYGYRRVRAILRQQS